MRVLRICDTLTGTGSGRGRIGSGIFGEVIGLGRVVCLGDSNTYGYDPRSWLGGRYPEEVRWTGRLRAAGWDVADFGENGAEIPVRDREIEAHERRIRQAAPVDVVVVMLGSNDLLQHPQSTAAQVAGRMEAYLRRILRCVPPDRILLLSPVPMRPGAWVSGPRLLEESARLGEQYGTLARRLGVGSADTGLWGVGLSFDGVHFTPDGHRAFAEELLGILEDRSS